MKVNLFQISKEGTCLILEVKGVKFLLDSPLNTNSLLRFLPCSIHKPDQLKKIKVNLTRKKRILKFNLLNSIFF